MLHFTVDFLLYGKYNVVRKWGAVYMAKMGRPKADKAKVKTITIRVTDEEHEAISQYAKAHNKTITQIVQQGVDMVINQQS